MRKKIFLFCVAVSFFAFFGSAHSEGQVALPANQNQEAYVGEFFGTKVPVANYLIINISFFILVRKWVV